MDDWSARLAVRVEQAFVVVAKVPALPNPQSPIHNPNQPIRLIKWSAHSQGAPSSSCLQ